MPRCTAVYRHVSHRVIYSPDTPEMPWRAMRSKNSAGARARGAHRLAHHPDSIALTVIAAGRYSEEARGRVVIRGRVRSDVFDALYFPEVD